MAVNGALPVLVLLLYVVGSSRCQTVIDPPTNVLVQFTGPNSFIVSWEPPEHPVIGYSLIYSGGTLQVDGDATYAEVVSNSPINQRQFSMGLYSMTLAGYSKSAETFTILNPADAPSVARPPTNVLVQFQSPHNFTVAWDPPEEPVDGYLMTYSGGKQVHIDGGVTSVVVVSQDVINTKGFSIGMYSYTAVGYSSNAHGFINLDEGSPHLPPKPSGTRKLVVPDSLQLDWAVPDGEFEHYRLIYSTDGTKEKETTVELPPETTSYLIEGLTGQFYTNLYTIRNGIKSDLGEWRENTDKVPLPPKDIYLQRTSDVAFTLAWTKPNDTIDGYVILYSPDEVTQEKKMILNNSMSNIHIECDSVITDQFRIGLLSVRGSMHSESAEVHPLLPGSKLLPPIPVVTQRLLTPSSSRLELSIPTDSTEFDKYQIRINKTDGLLSVSLDGSASAYVVDGIVAGKETMAAVRTVRNGIRSDPTYVVIPDPKFQKPSSPTHVTRHNLNRFTIVLNWDPPPPPFDRYYLDIKRDNARSASNQKQRSVTLGKNATSYIFTQTRRRERYVFTLYAVLGDFDAFGTGVKAVSVPAATTRSKVTLAAVTQHALQVTWQPVVGSSSYSLTVVSKLGEARTVELPASENAAVDHVFLGLEEGMDYYVILDAVIEEKKKSAGWVIGQTAFWGNVVVRGHPPTALEVTWPDYQSSYLVSVISANGEDIRVISTQEPRSTLSDVEPEVTYEIGVQVVGEGEELTGIGGASYTLVKDTTPPTITNCPAHVNDSVPLGSASAGVKVLWLEPEAIDDTGATPLGQSTHRPGETFPIGDTSVSYVFTDTSGNQGFCNFTVTVDEIDIKPPVISNCPENTTHYIYAPVNKLSVSWEEPTALDDSGSSTTMRKTHRSGSKFRLGSTVVTYQFTDTSGNAAACHFVITVELIDDKTPPVITRCPSKVNDTIRLGTPGVHLNFDVPRATDESGTVKMVTASHLPGEVFAGGRTPVTYVFEDLAGNRAVCTFFVTVYEIDDEAPVIHHCPSNINKTTPVHMTSGVIVKWAEPYATDNSNLLITVTRSHKPKTSFPAGRTTVVYTFTDSSNNSVICQFDVTVLEGICDCYVEETTLKVMSHCILPSTCDADRLLDNLTNIAVNEDNVEIYSGALNVISTGHDTITADGIESFAAVLEHIAVVGSTSSSVISNIIKSTDNILQTPTEEFKLAQDSSMANTRILNSLDYHLLFAHRGNRNFIRTEDNVAVWTESVPRNSTVTYSMRNGSARVVISEDEVTADENYAGRSDDVEASISLPTDVYWYDTSLGIPSSSYPAIFTFYNNSKLFQSLDEDDINSGVISASVAGVKRDILFNNGSARITLRPWQEHPGREFECVFWNKSLHDGNGAWSPNGCHLTETLESGHIVCVCSHLTHFALRLTPKVFLIDIIVFAGCVLCIGMMTAAAMISLSIWAKIPHRTIINLCISLLFLNGLFLGGIDQIKLGDGVGCTIIAALLQYFLLVTLSWTAVESLNLFWQVVLIRKEFLNRHIVRVTIGCWGVPLLFVLYSRVIIFLLTNNWTENNTFCFLSQGLALYIGVVTPMVLLFVFHLYIIGMMLHKELCSRYGCSDRNIMHAIRRCKVSLPLSILASIGSVVCYFMLTNVDSYPLRSVFSIFALAEGALLLAGIYCLGKKDLMDKHCCSCCRFTVGKTSTYHVHRKMVGKKLYRNNGEQKAKQVPTRATRFTRVGTFRTPYSWKAEDI
ncbi:uncharacterized protein [Asterias amurensis]|uniref:uncharacterized protein isoform X2 n=1 Tax=Asterias amurensis TaxID=7602 RepID=UPI003AB72CA4